MSLSTLICLLSVTGAADDSCGSKAFIRVCLSVCPHDKTRTAETTITKLEIHHEHLPIHLILGQKVKGQGHRVTNCKKHIKDDRVTGVSYALYRLHSAQPFIYALVRFFFIYYRYNQRYSNNINEKLNFFLKLNP